MISEALTVAMFAAIFGLCGYGANVLNAEPVICPLVLK